MATRHGTTSPADQSLIELAISRCPRQIIFGGNYFHLGPARCYLVWDKLRGDTDYADAELAWTNFERAVRVIRWRWNGFLQQNSGDAKEERWHPTQKPLSVMAWALKQAPQDCKSVLDSWMGSGTTLVATKAAGLTGIGIEIKEKYCEIAAKRLSQETLQFTELLGTAMRDADEHAEAQLTLSNPAHVEGGSHSTSLEANEK